MGLQEDLNKPNTEILEFDCVCGRYGYYFSDLRENGYTVCKKCNRRIYDLHCPECKSGFAYPEDYKSINLIERTWKCEVCGKTYLLNDAALHRQIDNYQKEDIPKNLENAWKAKMGKPLLSHPAFVVAIIIMLLAMVIFSVIK